MAIGFGFSISDLCMGLKLIKDSVEALNDKKGAVEIYANLLVEVNSLREALRNIDILLSGEGLPPSQRLAIESSSLACQKCIEEFLDSISAYQPHLKAATNSFTSRFRKIQWALCRKEDIAKLRAQLARHMASINMLLITFQANQSLATYQSTISPVKPPDLEHNFTQMMQTLSVEQRQCFSFIMQQNRDLMQTLQDMRQMLAMRTVLPHQVLLDEPVILLDPFGKLLPFHLEFIDSSECFLAVLKARFSNIGVSSAGLSKLDNYEFDIEDTRRKKPIDIRRPWERIFHSGQKIDMRMTFHRFACPPSKCPGCLEVTSDGQEQIQCYNCGLHYEKIQAIAKESEDWETHLPNGQNGDIEGEQIPYILRHRQKQPELKVFRPPKEAEDELFEGYRRIQIVSQPLALLDSMFPALQLIEDFIHFAELVDDVPLHISPYRSNIVDLHTRAKDFVRRRDGDIPAFSSFAYIERTRKRLTEESLTLRHCIDILVRNLCNDPDTKVLVKYIKQSKSSGIRERSHSAYKLLLEHFIGNRTGYYAGALNVLVNLSEIANSKKTKTPRPTSKVKMEWIMFDSSQTKIMDAYLKS
ncbi:MAG: hypothetical protein Q9163_002121 [Psora crenata]